MSAFENVAPSVDSFGRRSFAITPNDSADLPEPVKAVVVLTAGTLSLIPLENDDGDTVDFDDLPVGYVAPFIVRRVMATGTTATVAAVTD